MFRNRLTFLSAYLVENLALKEQALAQTQKISPKPDQFCRLGACGIRDQRSEIRDQRSFGIIQLILNGLNGLNGNSHTIYNVVMN